MFKLKNYVYSATLLLLALSNNVFAKLIDIDPNDFCYQEVVRYSNQYHVQHPNVDFSTLEVDSESNYFDDTIQTYSIENRWKNDCIDFDDVTVHRLSKNFCIITGIKVYGPSNPDNRFDCG